MLICNQHSADAGLEVHGGLLTKPANTVHLPHRRPMYKGVVATEEQLKRCASGSYRPVSAPPARELVAPRSRLRLPDSITAARPDAMFSTSRAPGHAAVWRPVHPTGVWRRRGGGG